MKTSTLTLIAMAAFASAAPVLDIDLPSLGSFKEAFKTLGPFDFDYVVSVRAVPKQVVDSENKPTGGLEGSSAHYRLGFEASKNIVCYNITHFNWRGKYESLAKTATHLHEAPKGKAGPPRIAFPNPQGPNRERNTVGCIKGPFKTGIIDTVSGNDTGAGFSVQQIIDRPRAFFVDAHSSLAVPGAFRGQLPRKKTC